MAGRERKPLMDGIDKLHRANLAMCGRLSDKHFSRCPAPLGGSTELDIKVGGAPSWWDIGWVTLLTCRTFEGDFVRSAESRHECLMSVIRWVSLSPMDATRSRSRSVSNFISTEQSSEFKTRTVLALSSGCLRGCSVANCFHIGLKPLPWVT